MLWKKDEIEYLKANYSFINDSILFKALGRSLYSIRTKANRHLNLKKVRVCVDCACYITSSPTALRCGKCSIIYKAEYKREKYLKDARKSGIKPKNVWFDEDLLYLKKNYPYTEDEILAGRLNRSISTIRSKANKYLGLKKHKRCVECKIEVTGRSSNVLRCEPCSVEYKKNYKKKWTVLNAESVKRRRALWKLNNSERYKRIAKLWRIKNRARRLEAGRLCYKKIRELENKRRRKLSLPLIGIGYSREFELLRYVQDLFHGEKIIHRDRKTLKGLELDIFLPNLKLAFEYQGEQHYKFVKFFHGDYKGFEKQINRDLRTKQKCKELGINLIEFPYYENLSEQLLLSRLAKLGINTNQHNLVLPLVNRNIRRD